MPSDSSDSENVLSAEVVNDTDLNLSDVPRQEGEEAPPFRMKDLLDAVGAESELKRSDLRDTAVDLGEAIAGALRDGRTVILPGLGKITPRKREEKPSGVMVTARIKLPDVTENDEADGDDFP
ncbi:HU family DNA-binding protein [Nioella nitratireducens]|uniref:HU family DNA-binding protein n=1 Tax=Nioella nitratireducens TaxID=1287720 RepID=UPI0008FD6448|nr:HU family DNA-binding protein [Nioella nitratireducens]